jgi:hypothetical protein
MLRHLFAIEQADIADGECAGEYPLGRQPVFPVKRTEADNPPKVHEPRTR